MLNDDSSSLKTALVAMMFNYFHEISGRTRIQKMLYLVNMSGWNIINDYLFYQYGPYSEWLKRDLETLVQNKFISEETQDSDDYTKTIYKYSSTKAGRKFFDGIIKVIDRDLFAKTRSLLMKLNNYSTDDLEIMASLLYLSKSDPSKSHDKLIQLVKLYKPRFPDSKIRKNLEVFEIIKGQAN